MAEITAQEQFSGTKEVDPRLSIDPAALDTWMDQHVDDYRGPLQIAQFKGGQSNPTYKISTAKQNYVLRRKPPGKLLKSAHAVDREYRVMTALGTQNYPVPKTYGLCEDESVLGTAFFVMEMVEGRILWGLTLPDCDNAHRQQVYEAKIDGLAQLHNIDFEAAGLGDYGPRGDYFARQVGRWSKQYSASETEKIHEMDRLMKWLPGQIPSGDETSIVHGDYRLDNMVLHASRPEIAAVLDWELSTLGHPLADFTYFLMQWLMPFDQRMGLSGLDLEKLHIPSMEVAMHRYCEQTGREKGIENPDFYYAFNLFRLAAICQGIAGRVRDGTAASEHAMKMASRVKPLAEGAWFFAQKAGATA